MEEEIKLQDIITQYLHLTPPNNKGWRSIRCHVCNDHTRKGLRGNFLFDGDVVVYKCWNCGIVAKYDPDYNEFFPKKMKSVLDAFGIPESEYLKVVFSSPAYRKRGKNKKEIKKPLNIEPKEIKLPSFFYLLDDAKKSDITAKIATEYLISRNINPKSYPFMLAKKTENEREDKWLNRVIIPIFKNKKLIFYIARDLTGNATKKYETPSTEKSKVLYGFDFLFKYTTAPLIIVEGWFDAFLLNGVAILGNIISKEQIEWLNRSKREKIYVPDKFGDGEKAALQAINQGWYISTPDVGQNVKDMSDAIKKYGRLYVLRSILKNKSKGEDAKINLVNYCN